MSLHFNGAQIVLFLFNIQSLALKRISFLFCLDIEFAKVSRGEFYGLVFLRHNGRLLSICDGVISDVDRRIMCTELGYLPPDPNMNVENM